MMWFNLIIKILNVLCAIFKKQNVHSVWSSLAPIFNNQLWPSSPVPVGRTLHCPTSGLPKKPWCDSTWQPQTTSVWNWRNFYQENSLAGVKIIKIARSADGSYQDTCRIEGSTFLSCTDCCIVRFWFLSLTLQLFAACGIFFQNIEGKRHVVLIEDWGQNFLCADYQRELESI